MGIKCELLKVRDHERLIYRKLDERKRLEDMVLNITSTLKQDVVQSSGGDTFDRFGDAIARIVDIEIEINDAIDRFVNAKREVMKVIDELSSPYSDILYLRYFRYNDKFILKTWEEIAVELGYSYRSVIRLHGDALKKFAEKRKDDLS